MGIPKFFRHITKKHPEIICNAKVPIENIFFDMNCLIHPCVQKVCKQFPELVKQYNKIRDSESYRSLEYKTPLEEQIYISIDEYLDYLIDYISPSALIYMAIDGVAPRAKMEQQRVRRYRSIYIREKTIDINKKHNYDVPHFDSNCITPGTVFMKKLSNHLKVYMKLKYDSIKVPIYLDDAGMIGEGEHKILQYIKKNCTENVNCIYGLDADLIMLSLVSNSKVYLLREAIHFGKVDMEELLLFDSELFSDKLGEDIQSRIEVLYHSLNKDSDEYKKLEIDRQRLINDYICICMFIGNDFLPSLPGLDININSIETIIDIYINTFSIRPYYLINEDYSINFIFLSQIFVQLYDRSVKILQGFQRHHDRFRARLRCNTDRERELEKLKFYPVFNKNNYLKLGFDNWEDKYYSYYFHFDNYHKNASYITDICRNYIEGFQWNVYYYLDNCHSYSWYYKYNASPTYKNLAVFFINRVYPPSFDNIEFTPLEQLSIVLPIQSQYLWCREYSRLSEEDPNISLHYPKRYKLDTLNHVYLHECNPLLSDISNQFIKKIFKNIILTPLEKILNNKTDLYRIEE